MSLETVERLANAVLYEGYMLYPYRPSAVKNQRRFNFGVLVPPAYSAVQSGTEFSDMRTECLVQGSARSVVDIKVRCLQIIPGTWQDAVERQLMVTGCSLESLCTSPASARLGTETGCSFEGALSVTAEQLSEGLYKVVAEVINQTPLDVPEQFTRDEVLPYSLVAAHTVLSVRDGEFVSLLDPPAELSQAASECRNIRTWPILAGEPGERGFMLSSPIILYDYAEVAPESPGDLFDGAEIDEILTLRILTLTDEEKQEVRNGDERARRMLERTEQLPEEHLQKLHGALRGLRPVEERR